jgi:hypothetical protein
MPSTPRPWRIVILVALGAFAILAFASDRLLPSVAVRASLLAGRACGDEVEGDFGYLAALAARSRRNCSVMSAVARLGSDHGNDVALDGYLRGLARNGSPWVREELVGVWRGTSEHWAKAQMTWALQQLSVGPATLGSFPNTRHADEAVVRAALADIERLAAQVRPRCPLQPALR